MKTELIVKYILLTVLVTFYLVYTIKFTLILRKDTFFGGRRRTFHFFMIWLFPFVWIWILKTLFKPIPGSVEFKDKKDPDKFDDNTTDWVVWAASSPPEMGNTSGESH